MKCTHPLNLELSELGPLRLWQVEWKWTGLKAQMHLNTSGITFTDSEGQHIEAPQLIPSDTASLPDGSILEGVIMPGPQKVFVAWDCVAFLGTDITTMPLYTRQLQAFPIIGSLDLPTFRPSESLEVRTWEDVEALLTRPGPPGTSGMVLKRTDSIYADQTPASRWWILPFKNVSS